MTVPMRALDAFGSTTTAMSEIRPDMTAGPIERKTSDRASTESGGSAASLRTAVNGTARPGWLTVGRPWAPASEATAVRRLAARSVDWSWRIVYAGKGKGRLILRPGPLARWRRRTSNRQSRPRFLVLAMLSPSALGSRYRVDHELGRGGMAAVYEADDVAHHRHVAIKVLDSSVGAALGAERFLREIQVAAGLQHPNILPVYDSGESEAGGLLYYVMPVVRGASLRAKLERERQLPIDDAVRIASQVAAAL